MEAKYLNSSGETTASGGSTLCKWHPRSEVGFINIVKPWKPHSSSPYRSSPYRLSAQWREQDFDRNRDFFFPKTKFSETSAFFLEWIFRHWYWNLFQKPILKPFFWDQIFRERESKKCQSSRPRLRLPNIFEIFWRGTQPKEVCLPLTTFFAAFSNFLQKKLSWHHH